uniref:CHK kinase-like domain-containing protein n=1 Tax=Timema poppense TaxID=170557 RepID=A0A7R9HD88_TIMPO|nr:unnamed protein product [Timema poppensis]
MTTNGDSGVVRKLAVRWEPSATDSALQRPNFSGGEDLSVRERKGIPELNKKFLQEMLRREGRQVEVVSFTVVKGSEDNYSSSMIEVNLMTTDHDSISLLFKTVHVTPQEAKVLNVREMFKKEVLMYQKVVPTLIGLFPSDPLNVFTPSYHSHEDLLVFENLRPLGFRHVDREQGLDLAHANLVLTELGRLHGAAYVLHSRSTEDAKALTDAGKEVLFTRHRKGVYQEGFAKISAETVEILRENPKTRVHADKVEAILARKYDILLELLRPKDDAINLLNHGDLWTGNLLFRYVYTHILDSAVNTDTSKKAVYNCHRQIRGPRRQSRNVWLVGDRYNDRPNKVPVQVVFLDLQLCRYGSPGLDVNYFLYTSTTARMREEHLDELLRTYHWSLVRTFRQLNARA